MGTPAEEVIAWTQTHWTSNADAVVEQENGILIFVEPYERSEPFVDFLDYVQQEGEHSLSHERPRLVKYAQTREYVPVA